MNPPYSASSGFGSAPAPGGTARRVRPAAINARNQSIQAGRALAANSRAFDCASVLAVGDGSVSLDDYGTVVWLAGRQRPEDGILTTRSQALLRTYVSKGGDLFLSGARVAEELDRPTTAPVPSKSDRRFLREVLHAEYQTTASRDQLSALGVEVDDGSAGAYNPFPVDWVAPTKDAATSTTAGLSAAGSWIVAAPKTGTRRGGQVVFSTIPFETILGDTARTALMRGVLEFFEGRGHAAPAKRAPSRRR